MDELDRWIRAAAEILNAPAPELAHELFIEGLLRQTHADAAARIGLTPLDPEVVDIGVAADPKVSHREHWPVASVVRRHPFSRYYATSGDHSPVLLTDLLAAGWEFDDANRAAAEAMGLTEHQLTLPCHPEGGDFDGWAVFNSEGFSEDDLARLTALQPLLVGLDRHVALLAELERLRPPPDPEVVSLTQRERVVLGLMAGGGTAEGIAVRLAISPRTVHKHQEHLYRKLGASDRLSAVLAAQRLGLLTAPDRR